MNTGVLLPIWPGTNPLVDVWRSFLQIAHHDELLKISLAIVITSALLAVLARGQRIHIRAALVMYALAFVLMAFSAIPAALGWEEATKALHSAGLLLVGCAFVKLASIIVFDVILCITPLSPPQVLRDITVATGYVGVGMWLLSRNGVNLSSLVTTSAVMTGIIVFSLQDSLSNILGGLVLQIDEAFQVGDWVKIDQDRGQGQRDHLAPRRHRDTQLGHRHHSQQRTDQIAGAHPGPALRKAAPDAPMDLVQCRLSGAAHGSHSRRHRRLER